MKEDKMEAQSESKLHRNDIEVYPHALKILVLGVHELVHLSNLVRAFFISLSLCLIQSLQLVFEGLQFGFAPLRARYFTGSVQVRVNLL